MHLSLDQCAKTEKSCNPGHVFAFKKNIETINHSVAQVLHTLPKTNIDPEKTALADDSPTSQGLRSSLGVGVQVRTHLSWQLVRLASFDARFVRFGYVTLWLRCHVCQSLQCFCCEYWWLAVFVARYVGETVSIP